MKKELLDEIARLSEKYPAMRLCQLIGNAIPPQEAVRRSNDIFYIPDEQLLEWLRDYERLVDKNWPRRPAD